MRTKIGEAELIHGEGLAEMSGMGEGSIDTIIVDPPYGVTALKWDKILPFDQMWEAIRRVIKPNGAIIIFGKEPFSSRLRLSNIKNYRYDWIWYKVRGSDFVHAKIKPMNAYETISVFYYKVAKYYPVMRDRPDSSRHRRKGGRTIGSPESIFKTKNKSTGVDKATMYPTNVLTHSSGVNELVSHNRLHPAQKPVGVLSHLINSYTVKGETVLDFTMGSGSTGVACLATGRKFIGVEIDKKCFNLARRRLEHFMGV